jgi:hypothetical protein
MNSDSVNQMFWNNVADKNNRVGNAVLGLCQTQDSVKLILREL